MRARLYSSESRKGSRKGSRASTRSAPEGGSLLIIAAISASARASAWARRSCSLATRTALSSSRSSCSRRLRKASTPSGGNSLSCRAPSPLRSKAASTLAACSLVTVKPLLLAGANAADKPSCSSCTLIMPSLLESNERKSLARFSASTSFCSASSLAASARNAAACALSLAAWKDCPRLSFSSKNSAVLDATGLCMTKSFEYV
mmetsp:Transcript_9260/g.13838  ORF Transcript_9260/g.13838 Transcript_9260/m.13838 type:complete len:204 (-) Transcript_9260:1373-1984(-)